jgi:antitoxin HicB
MRSLAYPATLTPDREAGGFTVIFPDLPEAITHGESRLDALKQAADCLDEEIAMRFP